MDSEAGRVELLPCPFCGGEAELNDLGDPQDDSFVSCTRPKCEVQQIARFTPEAAIAAWNTRPTPDNGLREALEPFAELCDNFVGEDEDDQDLYRPPLYEHQKHVRVGWLRAARQALSQAPR
jgi:Lar family restriction alleviation protein